MTTPAVDLIATPDRLDRHDTFVGMQIAVWFAGLGIYLVPIGTGPVGALEGSTQKLLGLTMLLGTTLTLLGVAMGPGPKLKITAPMRWFLSKVQKDYIPLSLRHCYRLDAAGLIATDVALAVFSWQVLNQGTVIGSFTGLMTPILLIVWIRKVIKLLYRAHKMDIEFAKIHAAVEDSL